MTVIIIFSPRLDSKKLCNCLDFVFPFPFPVALFQFLSIIKRLTFLFVVLLFFSPGTKEDLSKILIKSSNLNDYVKKIELRVSDINECP